MKALRLATLAFLAGGATMILELAAPRLVAPHLGTTTLAWTVTIATFLAGLALGNTWGGRLADRGGGGWARLLLLLASGTILLALGLDAVTREALAAWSHGPRTLVAIPATFLPVALALGMLPPWIARAGLGGAAGQGSGQGRVLGRLAAAGALGSVVGTALAGFVLVPRLGTRGIFLTTALVLVGAIVLVPSGASGPASARAAGARRRARPVPPSAVLLAATVGAALLVVEIAAARLASDRLGSSIYTWTAVIGVVLAGVAVGNVIGGRLADRHPPRALLATLLGAAAVATLWLAWAPSVLDHGHRLEATLSWPLRVLLAVGAATFAPSVALGTLTPVVIRASLASRAEDGRIVGALYGAATVGAVLATVATSYLVLPGLGIECTLLLVPALFLLARAAVRRRAPWALGTAWLATALLALAPLPYARPLARVLGLVTEDEDTYVKDSRYARIRVQTVADRWVYLESEPDTLDLRTDLLLEGRVLWDEDRAMLNWRGPMGIPELARLRTHMSSEADRQAMGDLRRLAGQDVRLLRLDRLIHSYVNLDDPRWLGYPYERVYDAVLRRRAPPGTPLRALFLGGGGYSFQRHLLASRPDPVEVVTVEIDEEVTHAARTRLGLRDDPRHEVHHEDARTYVATRPSSAPRFDVVFGDAFDDLAVPFHLTTREFADEVSRVLAPDGVYLVNMVDAFDSGLFLAAFVETLEQVFSHVSVLTTPPRVDDARNTFVLLASHAPVDLTDLSEESGRPLGTIVYPREEIEALGARAGRRVLTDDHAPVEILLAPVVEARR